MDKNQYEKNFFDAIDEINKKSVKEGVEESEQEKQERNNKTIKLIFLRKITHAIEKELDNFQKSKNTISIDEYNNACERIKKQIKHLLESFDITNNVFTPKDEKHISEMKTKIQISEIFRKVFDLIKDLIEELKNKKNEKNEKIQKIFQLYLDNKTKFMNIKGELCDQENKIFEENKEKILKNITTKIIEVNKKFQADNANDIALELKKNIIDELQQLNNNKNKTNIIKIDTIKTKSIIEILNSEIYQFFNSFAHNLSNYKNNADTLITNYISATIGTDELENKMLDFIKNKKKQTIDNAKQIFSDLKTKFEKGYKSKFNEKVEGSFSTTVNDLFLKWYKNINIETNLYFLMNKYIEIVRELESISDIEAVKQSVENLSNSEFSKEDLKITNLALDLLKTNCQKYIIKAKKHFKIIEKNNININEYQKNYNIDKIKNENLRNVFNDLLGSLHQIFSEDIKIESIEKWKKFYTSSIAEPIKAIIKNIKTKNKNSKINASDFEIKFTDEEKKRIETVKMI